MLEKHIGRLVTGEAILRVGHSKLTRHLDPCEHSLHIIRQKPQTCTSQTPSLARFWLRFPQFWKALMQDLEGRREGEAVILLWQQQADGHMGKPPKWGLQPLSGPLLELISFHAVGSWDHQRLLSVILHFLFSQKPLSFLHFASPDRPMILQAVIFSIKSLPAKILSVFCFLEWPLIHTVIKISQENMQNINQLSLDYVWFLFYFSFFSKL